MSPTRTFIAALLFAGIAAPVMAASSTASSAVGGSSASVGSISTSFQQSSASSSNNNKVAAGDYRIIEVAALAERPGFVKMTLRAVADDANADSEFALIVPQNTVAQNQLAAGHVVSAKPRVYGTEFALATTQQAFFLLVADDVYRELQAHAVVL